MGSILVPVMIFVSFSMPDESLKAWMLQAEKIHAPLVVRGFMHNSLAQTTAKITALLQEMKAGSGTQAGIQVNPLLFRKYKIEKVPAVVVENASSYDVLYGNTTLAYAFEKIASKNDSVSGYANAALQMLKKSGKQP